MLPQPIKPIFFSITNPLVCFIVSDIAYHLVAFAEGQSRRQYAISFSSTGAAMAIWVDADACPNVIKDILFRAAERTQISLTLVANQPLRVPPSRFIRTLRVAQGFDVADNEIVRLCEPGDLVITADIPLAAEVLAKGGAALNPRGERYSEATIRERLTMRDFMETMRASGVQTGGPDSLSQRDRQQFAAALEKWLLDVKRQQG
jgi:uncharacterized protein YaiI (UPF0178 family)